MEGHRRDSSVLFSHHSCLFDWGWHRETSWWIVPDGTEHLRAHRHTHILPLVLPLLTVPQIHPPELLFFVNLLPLSEEFYILHQSATGKCGCLPPRMAEEIHMEESSGN